MKHRKKNVNSSKLEIINRTRPRPEVRLRSVIFEDRTKYKRSREKQKLWQELNL